MIIRVRRVASPKQAQPVAQDSSRNRQKLERLLQYWLRYIRDNYRPVNFPEGYVADYSEHFTLTVSRDRQTGRDRCVIAFDYPPSPSLMSFMRRSLLECISEFIKVYEKQGLVFETIQDNDLTGDENYGCRFKLLVGGLDEWQDTALSQEQELRLIQELNNCGEELAEGIRSVYETGPNPDPFRWEISVDPHVKSLTLRIYPNSDDPYPADVSFEDEFWDHIRVVLTSDNFSHIPLRLSKVSCNKRCGTAILDLVEKSSTQENQNGNATTE